MAPPVLYYEGIAFGNGVFVAFGYPVTTGSSGPRYILKSPDGLTWTKIYETPSVIRSAVYGNGRFVFVGDRAISWQVNSQDWTDSALPIEWNLGCVTFGMGRFIATSGPGLSEAFILSSSDAVVWRFDYGPRSNQGIGSVAYGNGVFVCSWYTNNLLSAGAIGFLASSNLNSWQPRVIGTNGTLVEGVCFGGGQFIGSVLQKTYTSTNGIVWVNRALANIAHTFAFGAGTFVASAYSGILQSDVFAQPTNSQPSYLSLATYAGVTISGSEGQMFRIEYSTNLSPDSTWLTLTNISLPSNSYLWVDTTAAVANRRFYRAVLVE